MADHIAIAGLACDIVGALLLARALAFESPEARVQRAHGEAASEALQFIVNAEHDVERAADMADARSGLALLITGFVGQGLSAALASPDLCTAGLVGVYGGAALAIGVMLVLRRIWRQKFEIRFFAAHIARDLSRGDQHHREQWPLWVIGRFREALEKHRNLTRAEAEAEVERWAAAVEKKQGKPLSRYRKWN